MKKPNSWNEQTALITGGADGLGLALAKELASRGVSVSIFDINDQKLNHA